MGVRRKLSLDGFWFTCPGCDKRILIVRCEEDEPADFTATICECGTTIGAEFWDLGVLETYLIDQQSVINARLDTIKRSNRQN